MELILLEAKEVCGEAKLLEKLHYPSLDVLWNRYYDCASVPELYMKFLPKNGNVNPFFLKWMDGCTSPRVVGSLSLFFPTFLEMSCRSYMLVFSAALYVF